LPTVKRRTVPKVPGGSASQDSRIRTRSWTVALPLPVRRRCCVLVIGRQLPSISSTWRSVSGLLTPCELPRFGVSALTQSDQDKGRIQSELVMFTVTTEPETMPWLSKSTTVGVENAMLAGLMLASRSTAALHCCADA